MDYDFNSETREEDSKAQVILAHWSESAGETEKAESHNKNALLIYEKNELALNSYACLLEKLNRKEEAEIYFNKAIEVSPVNDIYLYNRGCLYENLARTEEAINDFQKALVINPSNELANNKLTMLLEN